jgi:hypothetical protein
LVYFLIFLSDPWRDDPEYDTDEEENMEEEEEW